MRLISRTWAHTAQGIKAIWVNPEIPDEVFNRLMEWAVSNIQGLIEAKLNPGKETPASSVAYDSWNQLWGSLQDRFPSDTDEGQAIAGFFGIVRDNPEIIAWVAAANKSELVGTK